MIRMGAGEPSFTAMIVMAALNLGLLVASETGLLAFAWSWLVILGTTGTVLLALGASALAVSGRDAR